MHKKFERTCIACKKKNLQNELVRFVFNNNEIIINTNKVDGRSAYVCNNKDCIEKMINTKALNKAFKCNINIEQYIKIKETLFDN